MQNGISKPRLAFVGHMIALPVGDVVIGLQWIGTQVYRVSVNRPGIAGLLGPELDGVSYSDEATARSEARRMVRAYWQRTNAQVEARREELADLVENNSQRRGPEAAARLRRYQSEADALQTLHGRAYDARLAAAITEETLTAVYEVA